VIDGFEVSFWGDGSVLEAERGAVIHPEGPKCH
jgi:hypothetical protein